MNQQQHRYPAGPYYPPPRPPVVVPAGSRMPGLVTAGAATVLLVAVFLPWTAYTEEGLLSSVMRNLNMNLAEESRLVTENGMGASSGGLTLLAALAAIVIGVVSAGGAKPKLAVWTVMPGAVALVMVGLAPVFGAGLIGRILGPGRQELEWQYGWYIAIGAALALTCLAFTGLSGRKRQPAPAVSHRW